MELPKHCLILGLFFQCFSGVSSDDDDDASVTPAKISSSIFIAITFLIIVTIIFETTKNKIFAIASENMRKVVEVLFAEMTVLGFLSLVTFAFSSAGIFSEISIAVFSNEDYLDSLFEDVHYMLFMVMVVFIFEVILLVRLGNKTEEGWKLAQAEVLNDDKMIEHKLELDNATLVADHHHVRGFDHVLRVLLSIFFGKFKHLENAVHRFEFKSMRDEFIKGRDLDGNRLEQPELGEDFDYARYLSINLGEMLAEIVELPVMFWLFLWFTTFCFYIVDFVTDGNFYALAIVWLCLGYMELGFMLMFREKIDLIRAELINPHDIPTSVRLYYKYYALPSPFRNRYYYLYPTGEAREVKGTNDEVAKSELHLADSRRLKDVVKHCTGDLRRLHLEAEQYSSYNAPGWCRHEPEVPKRSKLVSWLYGGPSSSMMRIFWLENRGPELHLAIIRFHLIASAIYLSIILTQFAPIIYDHQGGGTSGAVQATVYAVVGLFPFLMQWRSFLPRLARRLALASCLGHLRKRQIEKMISRKQKTERAIRTMMMLNNMRTKTSTERRLKKRAENMTVEGVSKLAEDEFEKARKNGRMTLERKKHIENIFKIYDDDQSGEVDAEELEKMLKTLGFVLDKEEFAQIYKQLDVDGDGQISLDEFLLWNYEMANEEVEGGSAVSVEELVDSLFSLFHGEGEGVEKEASITVSEFREGLHKLGADLTVDEVSDLVRELDKDGDGHIDKEEFKELLLEFDNH